MTFPDYALFEIEGYNNFIYTPVMYSNITLIFAKPVKGCGFGKSGTTYTDDYAAPAVLSDSGKACHVAQIVI